MAIEIVMPKLSDTMEEGKILKWLKKIGDKIEMGDIIAEVETDKADMEMEALDAGVLAEIRVQEGESIAVGGIIAMLSEDGAGVAAGPPSATGEAAKPIVSAPAPAAEIREKVKPAAEPIAPQVTVTQAAPPVERKVRELRESRPQRPVSEETGNGDRILASPLVRRMAEEHRLDLRQIHGSGPGGRIIKQDIESSIAASPIPAAPARSAEAPPLPAPTVVPETTAGGTKQPFSRMRATIAKRMADSMREVPHFYATCEVDMSETVRDRKSVV